MFRVFMLTVWALGAFYLVKSYVVGLTQIARFEKIIDLSMQNVTMLGGPTAALKDPSDTLLWFNIGAFVSLLVYGMFTKQIWKEFGPNA